MSVSFSADVAPVANGDEGRGAKSYSSHFVTSTASRLAGTFANPAVDKSGSSMQSIYVAAKRPDDDSLALFAAIVHRVNL